MPEGGFEDSEATDDGDALGASEFPGFTLIDDSQVGGKRPREQHRGNFAFAEGVLPASGIQEAGGHCRMHLDPVCAANRLAAGPACAENGYFGENLCGYVNSSKQPGQQGQVAASAEGDERRGVGDDDQSFSRFAVSRSSVRSAWV